METNLPIIFGILTTDTIEQAIERAGAKAGNKGFEAAVTAIEMASLMDQIDERAAIENAAAQSTARNPQQMGRV